MGTESTIYPPQFHPLYELKQIGHAMRAIQKVRSLRENMGGLQEVAIVGFDIFAPQVVAESGILASPLKRKITRRSVRFLMALNERLDLSYSGRDDVTIVTNQARINEEFEHEMLNQAIQEIPGEKQQTQKLLENTTMEVEGIEEAVRAKRDACSLGELPLDEIARYREVSNAINTCMIAGVMFGPEYIESLLQPLPDTFTTLPALEKWTFLQKRYEWLTQIGKTTMPANDFEKALGISWLLTMAGQVEDDRNDPTDRLLHIPSFGVSRETSDHELDKRIGQYENRALHLGLSFTANAFFHRIDTFLQQGKKGGMNRLAFYGFLDAIPVNKHYSLREQWFIDLFRDERRFRREKRTSQ